MTDTVYFLTCLAIMAGVTYLVRMLPMVLIRRKITNKFLKSFFYYIPYAVLSAMTIPAMLYAVPSKIAAAAGLVAGFILAFFERSLLIVAIGACAVAFIIQLIL
ncbi:MAG: AzlD domain-containing protein [Clostridia bacterium]|nr:AzlD domain-containing protein [Clostridia bacterium]MBR3839321.1 AzlD domain-containing protein [Clostridia bacterium]